ncbi:MAG: ribose 5-phosphate isomerase B [Bacteroidales bacterium]|jgi:ribose 5-phosphate isomerase B|nr:ribose 5-phosphate isomerase B [Bacteroidales bacterium]MDD4213209.1 ribose 5-phosphate isomerase B [Bacteroidales bacterium]
MNNTRVNKNIIAIGCDHAGFDLKENIKIFLEKENYILKDYGTNTSESMDYPDIAHILSKDINDGKYLFGIIICGSGNGMAMTANKYINVRAAICWTEEIAHFARKHNDANILSLPARFIDVEEAKKISKMFLKESFEGGRHQRRIEKIKNIIL